MLYGFFAFSSVFLVLNLSSSIGIVFLNKWVFRYEHFTFSEFFAVIVLLFSTYRCLSFLPFPLLHLSILTCLKIPMNGVSFCNVFILSFYRYCGNVLTFRYHRIWIASMRMVGVKVGGLSLCIMLHGLLLFFSVFFYYLSLSLTV